MGESHIEFVGPPELRNGHLLGFSRAGDHATVRVRSAGGREIALEFSGVTALFASRPEGMLLDGLAELRAGAGGSLHEFIFANSEEWDDAGLEITASAFRVLPADVAPFPGERGRSAV